MKPAALKEALLSYYASIEDRDKGVQLIKKYPYLAEELVRLAFSKEQKREHIVASWVLERLISNTKYLSLTPYFPKFLKAFRHQTHESKRRPFAKLLYHYCQVKENRNQLNSSEIDIIIACCFDTLLEAKKVAPKVHVLKTIVYFKNHNDWIEEELKSYIEKELPSSTAAFKAALRQILPF